jgi:hypothetical protein
MKKNMIFGIVITDSDDTHWKKWINNKMYSNSVQMCTVFVQYLAGWIQEGGELERVRKFLRKNWSAVFF